jgi:putative Mg2+ transporter-C (MgtC) family protein
MFQEVALSQTGLRLLLALCLGAIVGWEREDQDKPAGLRTHMLVALGAASFTLSGLSVFGQHGADYSNMDPIRVVEGVAGGIGFLGAGAIIKQGHDSHGLTTAASIWTVGGIGAACGAGFYAIAVATGAAALVVLLIGRLPTLRS